MKKDPKELIKYYDNLFIQPLDKKSNYYFTIVIWKYTGKSRTNSWGERIDNIYPHYEQAGRFNLYSYRDKYTIPGFASSAKTLFNRYDLDPEKTIRDVIKLADMDKKPVLHLDVVRKDASKYIKDNFNIIKSFEYTNLTSSLMEQFYIKLEY